MARQLDRLADHNKSGIAFKRLWQKNCEISEANIADIEAAQANLEATLAKVKIGLSWTAPTDVITAADAGADVTITIAAHTRIYADGSQVSVGGGSFTGQAYTTDYAIYYDDPTCSVTVPTYVITTSLAHAQNNYADGRHLVGIVTTPAAAGAPTSGGTRPSGLRDSYDIHSTA